MVLSQAKFRKAGLYVQEPEDVARMILGLLVREDFVGKAVYIEGGDGWEFEDGFYREQPRWLGEEPTRRMRINAEAVQYVDDPMRLWFDGADKVEQERSSGTGSGVNTKNAVTLAHLSACRNTRVSWIRRPGRLCSSDDTGRVVEYLHVIQPSGAPHRPLR